MHAHSCDFITFINERESIVREPAVSVFFSSYLLPCTICWGKKPQANGIHINLMVSIFHLFSLLCCRFLLLSFVCMCPRLLGVFVYVSRHRACVIDDIECYSLAAKFYACRYILLIVCIFYLFTGTIVTVFTR